MDLQAEWAMRLFSGRAELPSGTVGDSAGAGVSVLAAHMEYERTRRHMEPRPQFPHGEYSSFLDELSVEAGRDVRLALSNDALLGPHEGSGAAAATTKDELYRLLFTDAPVIPQQYRLMDRDPSVALAALKVVRDAAEAFATVA